MKIIDFDRQGNLVRFYLGVDDCMGYHGDDWGDIPYECNAGRVYQRYVTGHVDIVFPFETLVLEPCDGEINSHFCKNDMVEGKVPCIIVVPTELAKTTCNDGYAYWARCKGVHAFYFNDPMEPSEEIVVYQEPR